MSEKSLEPILKQLVDGKELETGELIDAFGFILSEEVDPVQVSAFLTILTERDETAFEIFGGAYSLQMHMKSVFLPNEILSQAIDVCGTGGDSLHTYNISTAVAFVVAACGVPVAKHGNRAMSSRSGAADVLETLGVNLNLTPEQLSQSIQETNLCFLFAQNHHPTMRHVAPIRKSLPFPTIFNLLGPLCNPAKVKRQIVGVYDQKYLMPIANAFIELYSEHVWVVHGADGMDELSITSESHVVEVKNGQISEFILTPEDAGLTRGNMRGLRGGTADANAQALEALLSGRKNTYRDAVLLNAAAALIIGGKVDNLKDGVAMATEAIDSRRASSRYFHFRDFTQQFSEPKQIS